MADGPANGKPTLPPEVLDLLSLGGRVRLSFGIGSDTRVVDVYVAPLVEGLFLLAPKDSFALATLEDDPRCVLMAEGQESGGWRVVTRGRGVPGRVVSGDPLRVQVAYWLPEGTAAADLVSVRFLPEHIEYLRGSEKFSGPVPNAAFPEPLAAWWALSVERQWPWLCLMVVSNFFAGIFLEENTTARFVLVAATLVPAMTLLAGVTLWNHGTTAVRWREGAEPESRAWAVTRGWLGAAELRRAGPRVIGVGLAMLPVLAFVEARLVPIALFSSGFGLLLPFHLVRHVFRHGDDPVRAVARDDARSASGGRQR